MNQNATKPYDPETEGPADASSVNTSQGSTSEECTDTNQESHFGFAAGARAVLTLAAFVIVVAGMRAAKPILIPILLAIFLAVIATPPLFWLRRKGVPKVPSVLLVLLGVVAFIGSIVTIAGTSLTEITNNIPLYQERLTEQVGTLVTWLRSYGVEVSRAGVEEFLNPATLFNVLGDTLTGLTAVFANSLMITIILVFALLEVSSVPAKLRAIAPEPDLAVKRLWAFVGELKRYIVLKTIISVGTGICATLLVWAIGIDYPLVWGLTAYLLNYIPTIGSIIASIPPVLLALVLLGVPEAIITVIGYFAINVTFGNLIEPRVMGRGLGISSLVVFLSLVFWGWMLGPIGMLISVPLTLVVKLALENSEDTKWIAVMIGSENGLDEAPEQGDMEGQNGKK